MAKTLDELQADIDASIDKLVSAQKAMEEAVAENSRANAAFMQYTPEPEDDPE